MVGLAAALVLAAVFLVAGATKIVAGPGWIADAAALGSPRAVAAGVPWLELLIGGALLSRVAPRVFGSIAVGVLVGFTAALVRVVVAAKSDHDRPPCACFGAWSRKPVGWQQVGRNGALVALAVLVIVDA